MTETQWKWVPVVPTVAMLQAADGVPLTSPFRGDDLEADEAAIYTAMLQAAPEPPVDLIKAADHAGRILDIYIQECGEIFDDGTDAAKAYAALRKALSSISGAKQAQVKT